MYDLAFPAMSGYRDDSGGPAAGERVNRHSDGSWRAWLSSGMPALQATGSA
jgi:hypothetical protein